MVGDFEVVLIDTHAVVRTQRMMAWRTHFFSWTIMEAVNGRFESGNVCLLILRTDSLASMDVSVVHGLCEIRPDLGSQSRPPRGCPTTL